MDIGHKTILFINNVSSYNRGSEVFLINTYIDRNSSSFNFTYY